MRVLMRAYASQVAGRDVSFDAKSKYELFRKNMFYHAKRTTPTEILVSDKELEHMHLQSLAHQRTCVYIYIDMYTKREREREREMCVCVYIDMYEEREK